MMSAVVQKLFDTNTIQLSGIYLMTLEKFA